MNDLKKLLRFASPYARAAALSLAALLAMVALELAIPRLVGRIVDEGIRRSDLALVLRTSGIMLAVSALSVAATILNNAWSIRVGEGVARDLREELFAKIQALSYGDLDRFPTGKLMVLVSSDCQAVQRLFQVSLRIGTRAPLTMAGCVVLMFVTSPPLAAAMIPVLAACAALIAWFSLRTEPRFESLQRRLDRLNTVLQENIAGARLVKAFVRGRRETDRFEAANGELAEDSTAVMRLTAAMTPSLAFLVNAGMAIAVWLGGARAARGSLSPGQIIAFANYLLALLHPLTLMTQLANTWANGLASAGRISEVLDAVPSVREAAGARELPPGSPCRVRLEGVGFRYDGGGEAEGELALEGIDLELEPGRVTAVLGATGSGKSSLANLLPRFYDPSAGRLTVDGEDLRDLRLSSILGLVAIVPQESVLFTGTVRDNIRYGRPGAGDEEVVAAARAAQAHDFILRLPSGYDSQVAERGANLSGGQRQRIAIARALIRRPRLLILDDSTSAVDVETETRIHRAIADYAAGCACLIVAQRVSTVLDADEIVVLDRGRIAARGRHAELLATSGIYREIYDSQLGGDAHE